MGEDVDGTSPQWIEGTEEEESPGGTEPVDGLVPGHNYERLQGK